LTAGGKTFAVKLTLCPAQTVVAEAVILVIGRGSTVTVLAAESPLAQPPAV
jgi:hypothetical protein